MKDFVFFDALAQALAAELKPEGIRDAQDSLQAFVTLLKEDLDLREAAKIGRLDFSSKGMADILDARVVNALAVLQAKGVLSEVAIFQERFKRVTERAGLGREVSVESAVPLTKEEKTSLQKTLEKRWGMPVFFHERVEPDLVGGFRLASRDWQFDATAQGRWKRLVQRLKT